MVDFWKKRKNIFFIILLSAVALMIGWRYWQDKKNHMEAYLDLSGKIEAANATVEELCKPLSPEEVEWAYQYFETWKKGDEDDLVYYELNSTADEWALTSKLLADAGVYVTERYSYKDQVAVLEPTVITWKTVVTGVFAGICLTMAIFLVWYMVRCKKYVECS